MYIMIMIIIKQLNGGKQCKAKPLTCFSLSCVVFLSSACKKDKLLVCVFIRSNASKNVLLASTGQENNTAQPKTDKWFSFPSHFSSFFAI